MSQRMLEWYVSISTKILDVPAAMYLSPKRQPPTESRSYRTDTPAPRNHHCLNSSRRLLSHSHSKSIRNNCTNSTSHWRISASPKAAACNSRRMGSSSHCTDLDIASPRDNRLEKGAWSHHNRLLCRDRCHFCEAQTQQGRLIRQTLIVDFGRRAVRA